MSDTLFHQTRMGLAFYESTMPALVRELTRLNQNLERLSDAIESTRGGAMREVAATEPEEDPV